MPPAKPFIEVHDTLNTPVPPERDNFPDDFLRAQTSRLPHNEEYPNPSDDWDSYLVSSARIYQADTLTTPAADPNGINSVDQVTEISAYLANIFRSLESYGRFLNLRGEAAQSLLDLLQRLLDSRSLKKQFRVILYVALFRLCRKSELYPRCFELTGVERVGWMPYASGGFGDVYQGTHYGKAVCVKVVKMYMNSDTRALYKAFSREAVVWGQLHHMNVLPFLGIYRLDDERRRMCLISPWMNNGNVDQFLKQKPDANRLLLISDIQAGIEYLHDNGVVHGDLKSINTLVTDDERACLSYFGLAYVRDNHGITNPELSSTQAEGGTRAFQAPELINPDDEDSQRTKESDIYAFGMTCYEILTGKIPFEGDNPGKVIRKVMLGEIPTRPTGPQFIELGLTDAMWALTVDCWNRDPGKRPAATQIGQRLPRVVADPRPQRGWQDQDLPRWDFGEGTDEIVVREALLRLKNIPV